MPVAKITQNTETVLLSAEHAKMYFMFVKLKLNLTAEVPRILCPCHRVRAHRRKRTKPRKESKQVRAETGLKKYSVYKYQLHGTNVI